MEIGQGIDDNMEGGAEGDGFRGEFGRRFNEIYYIEQVLYLFVCLVQKYYSIYKKMTVYKEIWRSGSVKGGFDRGKEVFVKKIVC